MREHVEAVVTRTGHELVGIADTTVAAVGLIEAARPDVVVLDLSLGYNTDFDMIGAAVAIGARAIVFSHTADAETLRQYSVAPLVVPKPDLTLLEQVLARLERDEGGTALEQDRRRRPSRAASGPVPTGVGDAQAFFEAISDAQPGDAMVSIEVAFGAEAVATAVAGLLRGTDRVLAFPAAVRVYLPGGESEGVRSLLERLTEATAIPSDSVVASIVVRADELGADAFARLKREGDQPTVPAPPN